MTQVRDMTKVILWRNDVFKRDGRSCRKCGAINHLHAHHIKSWAQYPDLRFDPSNGMILCSKCHLLEHGWLSDNLIGGSVTVAIRLHDWEKDFIAKLAKASRRTLSSQIRFLTEKALFDVIGRICEDGEETEY